MALALVSHAPVARADRLADAEELFRRARALVVEGKDASACPLFAESYRLDPGVGTLLNLALCHEKIGRVATAWGEFRTVEQLARASNASRAELARSKAEALAPRVSRLRIAGAEGPSGMSLRVDGEERPRGLWAGVPVDAGTHVVEASAPGYETVRVVVKVDDEGVVVDVRVPALAPAPVPEAHAGVDAGQQERAESRRARRTGGYITGAAGLSVLAFGSAFGVAALVGDASARDACPAPCGRGTPQAADADRKTQRAEAFANVSNVAISVGVVAVLVGSYLVLTSGSAPSGRAARRPLEIVF